MCKLYYINLLKHQALQKIVRDYSGKITPGTKAPVVVYLNDCYMTKYMTWGFPMKDKYIYNARSETILEKDFFQSVYTHRCLIPVSGFYEWTNKKQPVSYELDKPFYIAGIYQNNHFCMITTKANHYVQHIHHRMPLVLQGDDVKKWLTDDFWTVLNVKDYKFILSEV